MNFKIDTKEKFHVISLNESQFSANMTDKLRELFTEVTQYDVKHIILNLKTVQSLEQTVAQFLVEEQQKAYASSRSFVICELQPAVEESLEKAGILELMNVTPTESEAWDIVQMEEVERELLGGEES